MISKAFETVGSKREGLLGDRPYGIHSRCTKDDLPALIWHYWSAAFDNRGEAYLISLDTSKAFDRILNEDLLSKVSLFGFHLMSRFLNKRITSARVDGILSHLLIPNAGIPQDSIFIAIFISSIY